MSLRSITSDAWDYHSDANAYTAWLERACEVLDALEELRRRVENGGQHTATVVVSNASRRSWQPVEVTFERATT